MNKTIQKRLVESIDQLLVFVESSTKEDYIPRLQADEIFNGLLDARNAATTQPVAEPEREGARA